MIIAVCALCSLTSLFVQRSLELQPAACSTPASDVLPSGRPMRSCVKFQTPVKDRTLQPIWSLIHERKMRTEMSASNATASCLQSTPAQDEDGGTVQQSTPLNDSVYSPEYDVSEAASNDIDVDVDDMQRAVADEQAAVSEAASNYDVNDMQLDIAGEQEAVSEAASNYDVNDMRLDIAGEQEAAARADAIAEEIADEAKETDLEDNVVDEFEGMADDEKVNHLTAVVLKQRKDLRRITRKSKKYLEWTDALIHFVKNPEQSAKRDGTKEFAKHQELESDRYNPKTGAADGEGDDPTAVDDNASAAGDERASAAGDDRASPADDL